MRLLVLSEISLLDHSADFRRVKEQPIQTPNIVIPLYSTLVESFKYLGSSFTATDQAKDEISDRSGLARSAFTRLKSALWSRQEISLKTKGRIYETLIRTILLYGCETWSVRAEGL